MRWLDAQQILRRIVESKGEAIERPVVRVSSLVVLLLAAAYDDDHDDDHDENARDHADQIRTLKKVSHVALL
jgi:hypothetical protein